MTPQIKKRERERESEKQTMFELTASIFENETLETF